MKQWIPLFLSLMFVPRISAQTPDYSLDHSWAALPDRMDECDKQRIPKRKDVHLPDSLQPDVFYVYPTLYDDLPVEQWSAYIEDDSYRKEVQTLALRHQASVFGRIARIFVPYYRQMHIEGYRNKNLPEVRAAFDTAYADVLRAFNFYLNHYNKGRPFVIASHSQGTNHSERLIREFILNDSALSKRMVLAYLIGMPIKQQIDTLKPCELPEETHCYLSWRTYGNDFVPEFHGDSICVSHPVLFTSTEKTNELNQHMGILMPKGRLRFPKSIQVESESGFLRVLQLKFPFSGRYRWDNYHIADYNLFWMNIRANFVERMKTKP